MANKELPKEKIGVVLPRYLARAIKIYAVDQRKTLSALTGELLEEKLLEDEEFINVLKDTKKTLKEFQQYSDLYKEKYGKK